MISSTTPPTLSTSNSFTNSFNYQLSLDDQLLEVPDSILHKEDEWLINYKDILGKGNQSLGVYKGIKIDCIIDGQQIPNNGECVVKIIENTQIGKHELKTLNKLKEISNYHNNIIKIFGYSFGPLKEEQSKEPVNTTTQSQPLRDLYIYMEYKKEYTNLSDYIKQHGAFSEDKIKNISTQLINTLAELNEEHHIVHRDIKSSNIMYCQENGIDIIKLIDFGVSKRWDNTSQYGTVVGSPLYMAPEVTNGNASSRSDIWSVGCTLIEIAGGNLNNRDKGVPIIPSHLSADCKNFIQTCLIEDSKNRPKAIQLKTNEFLNILKESNEYVNISFGNTTSTTSELESYIRDKIKSITPTTTTHLKVINFKYDNDSTILLFNNIPSTITHLILQDYNQDLSLLNSLPTTVISLSLPVFKNQIKKESNSIPSHIKSLSIPLFNHDIIDESIPETLEELILGEAFQFNDYGGNLPDTIKYFKCSFKFEKELSRNNNIPRRASTLVLDNYNQSITKSSIPSTVHTLTLGSNYQHFESLANLPPSVFNLTFGVSNECELTNDQIKKQFVPTNITKISIYRQPNTQSNINNNQNKI